MIRASRVRVAVSTVSDKCGAPLSDDSDRKDGEGIVDECAHHEPSPTRIAFPKAQDHAKNGNDYSRDLPLAEWGCMSALGH